MRTPTHFLLTAFLGHLLRRRWPVRMKPFLLGSFLPDVPILLFTLWYFFFVRPLHRLDGGAEVYGQLFDNFYFNHPVWILGCNFLHAPLMLALYAAIGYWALRRGRKWSYSILWFTAGCALHSVADIFSHHNDGPLLWFPFDWQTRFEAPISYWHPAYHAGVVTRIEYAFDLFFLAYFLVIWIWRWWRKHSSCSRTSGMAKPYF